MNECCCDKEANLENTTEQLGQVLIVDDTEASLNLLTELLSVAGYAVQQAQHGELALLLASTRQPDLILLDIRMPGMDGFEVCRRLKMNDQTADIPVIFLSAMNDCGATLEGFRLGAVDYIAKPYESEEVLARVHTQVELRRLRLALETKVKDRTAQLEAEILERKQAIEELLESRQKLRELSGHLEDVREEERKRIARELHDELGQALTVQRIDLVHLRSHLDLPTQQIEEKLSSIIGMLDHIADTAREISENLRPGMLDVLGLAAAIKYHVEKFMGSTDVRCELQMNRDEFEVDHRIATAVFRILQESLTNVARHAKAKNVKIQLVDIDSELMLVVQDDGCGIAERRAERRRGFGLMGMRERASLLGGNFVIESAPGKGTRIEATFPSR